MSKSKKWRNGKKKHTLSPEEKLRNEELKQKRLEKQRIQKKEERISFIKLFLPFLLLALLFIAFMIIDIICDTDYLALYFEVALLIGIILSDNSGLRSIIFKCLPNKFLFSDFLKNTETANRHTVEICKTISFLSIWSVIFLDKWMPVFTLLWIISTLIIFLFSIFDSETSMSKDKDTFTASGAVILFLPIFSCIFSYRNVLFNTKILCFVAVFTIIMFTAALIAWLIYHKKKFIVREFIILTVGAIFFSFAAFTRINLDFDFSEPTKHYLTVEDMRYYGGRNRDFIITVNDWNADNKQMDISISSDDYHTLNIGDEVIILEYNGALGMKYRYYYGKADE